MGGIVNAAMLTELKNPARITNAMLELDLQPPLASHVTYRFAMTGGEMYDGFVSRPVWGWVKEFGDMNRGVGLTEPGLRFPSTSVTLVDEGDFFRGVLRGSYQRYFKNTPARIYILSPNAGYAGRHLWFKGVIKDWSLENRILTLNFQAGIALLHRDFPDKSISKQDYPNLAPEADGQYMPLLYGIHDSRKLSKVGMLPTINVDTVNWRRLLCAARAKAVRAVYKDGVPYTNYVVQYPEINGFLTTELKLGEDPGDSAITVDAEGYDDVGNGTGAVMTNPSWVIGHILTNWVFNKYQKGLWAGQGGSLLVVPPIIDTASYIAAAAFFDAFKLKAARYLDGNTQRKAIDIVDEWNHSFFSRHFIRHDGALSVKVIDHRKKRPVTDTLWYRDEDVKSMKEDWKTDSLVRSISTQYLYDSVANKYMRTADIVDATVPVEEGVINLQHPWSTAEE